MSMPTPGTGDPPPDVTSPEPDASSFGSDVPDDGWSLIALIPHDGREPPDTAGEDLARSVWCAVSAVWHPSLLARARELPRIESIEAPTSPGPREVRIVAGTSGDQLPSGYRTQVEDAGATLL